MGFTVNCDINYEDEKGKTVKCRQMMEPTIDKNTGEIYCECGKKLTDQNRITDFAKRKMVDLGQVYQAKQAEKQPYSVKCACGKEGQPVLSKDGLDLLCCHCGSVFKDLNRPFAHMLKERLRSQRKVSSP